MANIDFPPGAINGTTHTQNGKTWVYDGTSWSLVASIIPDASTTVSGLVNTSTQSFGGDKKFVNNLDIVGGLGVTGQSVFRSNVEIQSGGLGVTGALNTSSSLGVQGTGNFAGGLGVTGTSLFRNTVTIQSGGIGITGQSVFRNNVEIQSGGLGVTGGIGVTGGVTITGSGLAVVAGGLGITGQSVFRNNVEVQSGGLGVTGGVTITSSGLVINSGGLGVTGQSVFRNNVEIQSGGLGVTGGIGVTGGVTITGSGLTVIAGGIGITGQSVFRNNVEIQSGGIGITGQSVFRNNVEIQSGGLGVTGGIGVTGGVTITGSGLAVVAGGVGITGQSVFRNNVEIQSGGLGVTGGVTITSSGLVINSGGLGVTGQSVFRNNVEIQSGGLGVTGGIGVTGGVTITGSGLTVNAGGLGVTGASIFRNTVTIQSGGIGITGQSVFRNNIEIQSGGLGVTGGIGVTGGVTITGSGLAVMVGGIGVTGQSVFRNNVEIQSGGLGVTGGVTVNSSGLTVLSGGLGVTGQSVLRNNVEIQSGGIGVTGGVTVTSSGLTVLSGGIGITGQSVFRNNVEIQSGGLGVSGGIGVTGRITIHAGGLGVTGSAVFSSSLSAGSLSLSTPLPLSSGGTGLGSTSLANYILGMSNNSLGLEYKQIIEGSNITVTHNTNSITIAAVGTSATPGGPNNAIQYNGSGTLAGTSAFLWDNSSQRIDIKNSNAIGTGTTTGFLLQNSTASTVSVQLQFSPAIEFIGRAWKTSGSPATDTLVRYLEMVEVTSGATPTGSITWKSSIHNAANQGPSYTKRAEISTNYGLGIYETTGVYKSSFINSASVTTDIYYTLPSVIPSANQVLGVTGISTSSVSLTWVSNGTVAIGTTGALAYYPGIGTTVDDATALSYSTSGTHLVITSQTATDVPLRVDGNASSSVNLFQVRKGTTDQFVINGSGNVSISSSTGSTSSITGALTVTGGVGIGETLYLGGNFYQNSNAITAYDTGFRNRIINGDFYIDQRNSAASITPSTTQNVIDRWKMNLFGAGRVTSGQNYGGVASPSPVTSYYGMKVTTTSTPGVNDYNFFSQVIEGPNTIDLQWGTASAQPITLSFWAYSSLTGTFGGSIRNNGTFNRSYPFTYTISSANTWEKKTVVIPGDTTGTWTTSTGFGLELIFIIANGSTYQSAPGSWASGNFHGPSGSLANLIGTLNSTLYLTAVQIEIGSVSTPFEKRNYGYELFLCQRYYQIVEVRVGGYNTTGSYLRGSAYLNTLARQTTPLLTVISTDESSNLGSLSVDNSNFRADSFRYLVQVTTAGDAYGQWKVSCDTEF